MVNVRISDTREQLRKPNTWLVKVCKKAIENMKGRNYQINNRREFPRMYLYLKRLTSVKQDEKDTHSVTS